MGIAAARRCGGEITIGSFAMYIAMVSSFTKAISRLMESVMEFKLVLAFLGQYHVLRDMTQSENGKKEKTDIPKGPYTFEFRDVSFCYPNTEKTVLKNVNLVI